MSEHTHVHKSHTTEYIIVFVVLSLLTGLELAIPGLNVEYYLKAISLVGLAFGKAAIVAYFYMHLKEERGWLKFIAMLPIAAVVFAIVIILESIYR
ncbi:MAG: cytochrome C oxidase subunit IV family protein [Bacteriovorax sp.]|nr:cytochrome C oxidase subunit IV family protein [Bacteriovorax sp.]